MDPDVRAKILADLDDPEKTRALKAREALDRRLKPNSWHRYLKACEEDRRARRDARRSQT